MFYFLWMLACCLVFLPSPPSFHHYPSSNIGPYNIVSAHDPFFGFILHFSLNCSFFTFFFCYLYTVGLFFLRCCSCKTFFLPFFYPLPLFQLIFFSYTFLFFSFHFLYPISPPIISSTCSQFYLFHHSLQDRMQLYVTLNTTT